MRRIRKIRLAALLAAVALGSAVAHAQTLLSREQAAKSVAIENLQVSPSGVSGVVVNRTQDLIRSVEVIVQYHWLWHNEFKPGTDSPGQTVVLRIDNELQPGQSAPFRHSLGAGADRKAGEFSPEVMIGGFTVVTPAR